MGDESDCQPLTKTFVLKMEPAVLGNVWAPAFLSVVGSCVIRADRTQVVSTLISGRYEFLLEGS